MKVRMTADVSGTRNGETWPPRGSVVELPDTEAIDYINADMAVPVAMPYGEPEHAVEDTVDVEIRAEESTVTEEPVSDELPPKPRSPNPKDFRGQTRR